MRGNIGVVNEASGEREPSIKASSRARTLPPLLISRSFISSRFRKERESKKEEEK